MTVEQALAVRCSLPKWPRLGHQQLSRECFPGSNPLRPDGIICLLRDRPEPVEALTEVPDKAMSLTEALRSARGFATAKYLQPFKCW